MIAGKVHKVPGMPCQAGRSSPLAPCSFACVTLQVADSFPRSFRRTHAIPSLSTTMAVLEAGHLHHRDGLFQAPRYINIRNNSPSIIMAIA